MKHLLLCLLACLLLCGCTQAAPAEETLIPETETVAIPTASPEGLYAAGSKWEQATNGAIRAYPLNLSDARGLKAFVSGVLLFSGEETTVLTLLTGDELHIAAVMELDFFLDAEDPSLVLGSRELSFFDPVSRETVVLDSSLRPIRHIAAPEDLTGTPVLSSDRNTLYYCTSTALRAWDLESGIHRTVKEMSYPGQTVSGVYQNNTILVCQAEADTLFLAADTGRLVQKWEGDIALYAGDNIFCASFQLGLNPVLVFGEADDAQILLPEEFSGTYTYLKEVHGALLANGSRLEYYDLSAGTRSSVLTLEQEQSYLTADAASDRYVYVLTYDADYGCHTVLRWDTAALDTNDSTLRTGAYATEESPQKSALAQCQAYAEELSRKYGIEILIGEEAAAVQPWDYDLEAETQPALIARELALLDQRLSNYPEGMLSATGSNFTSLQLCLVRSVTGSAESGSLDAATGVQFLEGTNAYVAVTVGRFGEQALYHELFHVMETHILNYSIAFDQWETLNPSGFEYDYGYAANVNRDSGIYLQREHRAFIDTYSMSFPKEDRARVFEYAMQEGNKELFEAPALQAKLKAICSGIREAYGLKKSEETFLWEQYLK